MTQIDSTIAAQGIETSFGWLIKPWGAVTFLDKISPEVARLVEYLKIDGLDIGKMLMTAAKAEDAGKPIDVDWAAIVGAVLRQGPVVLDIVRATTRKTDDELEALAPDQLVEVLTIILTLNADALGNCLRQTLGSGVGQGVARATADAARRKARKA